MGETLLCCYSFIQVFLLIFLFLEVFITEQTLAFMDPLFFFVVVFYFCSSLLLSYCAVYSEPVPFCLLDIHSYLFSSILFF